MIQVLFDIVISIVTFSDNINIKVNLNGIEKLNEESLLSPNTWTIRT